MQLAVRVGNVGTVTPVTLGFFTPFASAVLVLTLAYYQVTMPFTFIVCVNDKPCSSSSPPPICLVSMRPGIWVFRIVGINYHYGWVVIGCWLARNGIGIIMSANVEKLHLGIRNIHIVDEGALV